MFFGCMGRFTALLVLLAAAAFTGACDFAQTTTAPPAGMRQEVRDGKLAFIVNQVNTSPTFGGDTPAQGVYVIVSMTVKNIGTEAWHFEMEAQKLKDSVGREYSASFMDPLQLGDNLDPYQMNPGFQVSVKLAFNVPPDIHPTQIVLHDSASSGGVPVNLS
jgi:hypothetical protein